MSSADCCTPRVRNAAATRQAILDAATELFSQESYENVGVREIAAGAGADVALVNRYFGSKKQLFIEALGKCEDAAPGDVPVADLPAHYADIVMDNACRDTCDDARWLMIILRSASSPEAGAIVRETFLKDSLGPLSDVLGTPEGDVRAALLMAVCMGITILRDVMTIEPLFAADKAALRARIVRLFEATLSN